MTNYVALLRGIGPGNPNMHGSKLKEFFERLGFTNVTPVISSGNVVFQSPETDEKKLENKIENALPDHLNFKRATIVISQEDLQKLANKNPFSRYEGNHSGTLNVTFLKNKQKTPFPFPHQPEGKTYKLLNMYDEKIVTSVIDLSGNKTVDLMAYLEKVFSRDITTRTWKTIGRIRTAMERISS